MEGDETDVQKENGHLLCLVPCKSIRTEGGLFEPSGHTLYRFYKV